MEKCIQITTSHDEVMVDEKFKVLVTGLKGGQLVSIEAVLREGHVEFASVGCFIADEVGNVDNSKQASVSGTYKGIDTMGLIWSMQQTPGQKRGRRLYKKDVCSPEIVKFYVYNGHCNLEQIYFHKPELKASTSIKRWRKAKKVSRIPVRHGQIRGTLFIPQGEGPFKPVLDVFGGSGGLLEFRAAGLASHGFMTLALAYFNYDDLPTSDSETVFLLNLDYFREAVAYLVSHPLSYKNGIGAVGVSKGAEILQLLAIHCPQIKALVSISGCPYLSVSPIRNGDMVIMDQTKLRFDKFEVTSDGLSLKNAYPIDAKHFFPVWDAEAKILSICGMDDQNIPFELNRLQYDTIPHEKKHKFQFIGYKGAGHLIEPPYTPFVRSSYFKPFDDCTVWGGNAVDHAHAQEDSWFRIIEFLRLNIEPSCKHKQQSKL